MTSDAFLIVREDGRYWSGDSWVTDRTLAKRYGPVRQAYAEAQPAVGRLRAAGHR